jgi:acyl-CoA thioester hydrolase
MTATSPNQRLYEMQVHPFWSDQDMAGHVNHVQYFRYCEEARVCWIKEGGLGAEFVAAADLVIGAINLRYVREWKHGKPLKVVLELIKLGTSSLTLRQALYSTDDDALIAEGEAVMICFDSEARCSRPFPPSARQALGQV